LTSLKLFVADEEDRNRAQKRGGGHFCRLNFRQARSATNARLRTMRRPSGSSNDAGRSRCSTASSRSCAASSCITAGRSTSSD
jgi:hypothetical protein